MAMNCIVDVVQCEQILCINDNLDSCLVQFPVLNIFPDIVAGLVLRGVVNVDDVVVVVLLHEDGVQVTQVESACHVVVGGDDDAEGQLVGYVLAELILGLVSVFL